MALTNKLSAIGNAIRNKTGKSGLLTLDQMPSEIASIQTATVNEVFKEYVEGTLTKLDANDLAGITKIKGECFTSEALTHVIIPSSVQVIEYSAFLNNSTLVAVEIGSNVASIENSAFSNCPKLKGIVFKGTPASIGTINNGSFADTIDIYVPWSEGAVSGYPWGFVNSNKSVRMHYEYDVNSLYVDSTGVHSK